MKVLLAALSLAMGVSVCAAAPGERICIVTDKRFNTAINRPIIKMSCNNGQYGAALFDEGAFWRGAMACLKDRCAESKVDIYKARGRDVDERQIFTCREVAKLDPPEWSCDFFTP